MFQDITTLLLDTKAFKDTIDLFVERYRDQNISVVAGTLQSILPCFFFFYPRFHVSVCLVFLNLSCNVFTIALNIFFTSGQGKLKFMSII